MKRPLLSMAGPRRTGDEVEELRKCLPGQSVAVYYSDDTYWHERVLLWKDVGDSWYIVTPDDDVYCEDLSLESDEGPSRMKIKGFHFDYWGNLRAPVYRFKAPLEDEELKTHLGTALADLGPKVFESDAWRPRGIQRKDKTVVSATAFLGRLLVPRRVTRPGGTRLEEDASPEESPKQEVVKEAPEGFVWLVDEVAGKHIVGDEVDPTRFRSIRLSDEDGVIYNGHIWVRIKMYEVTKAPERVESRKADIRARLGDGDLKISLAEEAKGSEETPHAEDARTLFVDYDDQNERYKDWRKVVNEMTEYNFRDWPLDGPLSTLHLSKHMLRNGGDPRLWLQVWARHKGIAETDRVMFELRTLIEILHLGGVYDQLNMASLSSFESAARRIQSIVDAYASGSSGAPDWGAARIISGYKGPDDAVSPTLRSWAAKKGKEEVELAQARTKIREAKKGLLGIEEAAATAVADGVLPSGAGPKPKAKKGRGKGLEPPAAS